MINDKEFSLAKPHCVSHARFMQRGINYITLQLHGHQADYMNYTESEQQEVELMAEYTALYYAPRFLQSSLPAEAPIMDLRNIWDIRELHDMAREELNKDPDNRATRLRQEAAQKNLDYIYLHPDYVTQQDIVFSLAGKVMEATDKKIIATRIWQQLQVARLRASPSSLTSSRSWRLTPSGPRMSSGLISPSLWATTR